MSDELYGKYTILKDDGKPVDADGMYFVLKLNSSNRENARASQEAVLTYANNIEETFPRLAQEIRLLVEELRRVN
jgi:hypothetical protein